MPKAKFNCGDYLFEVKSLSKYLINLNVNFFKDLNLQPEEFMPTTGHLKSVDFYFISSYNTLTLTCLRIDIDKFIWSSNDNKTYYDVSDSAGEVNEQRISNGELIKKRTFLCPQAPLLFRI